MSVDVELRNSLAALSGQVAELTKQTKTLDTSLANALGQGARHSTVLRDRTRETAHELSNVGQFSEKLTAVWSRQIFTLVAGAVGVNSLWRGVTDSIAAAQQRAMEAGKATADFSGSSRVAGDNPAMRRAMRKAAPLLTPEEQVQSLKAFRKAGGSGDAGEIDRLGSFLDAGLQIGLDPQASAAAFGKLRAAGITNPEDVISRAGAEGTNIDSMKPGNLRAFARQAKTVGAFDRAKASTKLERVDLLELQLRAVRAAKQSRQAQSPEQLESLIAQESGAAALGGAPEAGYAGLSTQIAQGQEAVSTPEKARAEARRILERGALFKGIVTESAVEGLAKQLTEARGSFRPVPKTISESVQRVIIDGDKRPTPVNAGD